MNLPTEFLAIRERFLSKLPDRLERMRALVSTYAAGDPSALNHLKREAHSLVGAAGLHEMTELARRTSIVEELASTQTTPERLCDAIEQVTDTIENPLSLGLPATPTHTTAAIALLFQGQDEMVSQAALLTGAGYRVSQYDDIEAFEASLTGGSQPALLLLGLQFNNDDYSGIDYLTRLRKRQSLGFPIIVLSANRSLTQGMQAYREGAARVLAQPIRAEALLHHVADTLAAQKPNRLKLMIVATAPYGKLAEYIATLTDPMLSFSYCNSPDDIPACLDQTAIDAIMLDDSGEDVEPVRALTLLLQDHVKAAHLPILTFTSRDDQVRRANCWAAGSNALVDTSLTSVEFSAMLRALCRDAESGRNNVAAAACQHYEHVRQCEALDHHAIISMADATGTLFETSSRHDLLTGFARTELIGSHLWEPRNGLAPPELSADIIAQVQNGQVWQGEYPLSCKHDQTLWMHTTLVPYLDLKGRPYQYMVIRSDITARKLGEQALAEARCRETALSAVIQETLLLPPLPNNTGGIPVASRYRASAGVAGDFHAMIELGPDTFDLMIGDVMGKGIPAALIGAAVKMELNQCLLDLAACKTKSWPPQPSAIIDALHQRLASRLIELECFVTLAYVRFDQYQQTLTSVGCGHPEILIFTPDGFHEIQNQHPPLGIIQDEIYKQITTPWPKGSVVLLYSDGLSETTNSDGNMLEVSGLKEIAVTALAQHNHPAQVATHILNTINQFAGEQSPADDSTLIVVRHPADHEVFIDLANTLNSLPGLREFLLRSCSPTPSDECLDRIVLASVEAFTNIVKHAQSNSNTIGILLQQISSQIELSMHYDGVSFELPEIDTLPEPEAMKESGYGLALIRTLCDEFTCTNAMGSNAQHLVFIPNSWSQ